MEPLFLTPVTTGERLDAFLASTIPGMTRNAAQRLLESGAVVLATNNKILKKNYRVTEGESLLVTLPDVVDSILIPQDLPLEIAFEDEDVIVINKPRGMVVHPAPGHSDGTLVNALLYHCGNSLSGIGGEKRPGIVHRIDKDTSGLLIVAKNDMAHGSLSAQLADRSLSRIYEAVVCGKLRENGTVNAPIGRHPVDRKRMAVTEHHSRPAVTHYEVLATYKEYTHVRCRLETGRTHQIRVHMAYIGHPLLGDLVYGRKKIEKGLEGQCLHAKTLKFIHPRSGEQIEITTELPDYFIKVLDRLGPPE